MVEMHLAAIRVELPSNTPVVLLQENGGSRRTLPILIGHQEATAIAYALQGIETPRPMTHDLIKDLLAALGVKVDRVVVTELVESVFYAEIRMTLAGRSYSVSSRPSDAMALAVRLGVPIFAEDALLDAEGVVIEDEEPAEKDDLINQFQRFIEDVRPEDFAS
ncbi:MAG: bifunctional nuclease family protein [Acidimicrobiales bacterium]